MSTISIMPINTKLRVNKRTQIPYSRKLAASSNIEKANCILGNELILDEGCHIRFEGFSASATDKSYPEVKITVFPISGKAGQIYVSLEQFDGLTWEPISEETLNEDKKHRGPIRRYEVVLNGRGVETDYVWHNAFDERYNVNDCKLLIVNPLALKPQERKDGFFSIQITQIGEAMFSIDSSKTTYNLQVRASHEFKTELMGDGLLGAKCVSSVFNLEISPKWENSYVHVGKIEINETDVVKMVKDYLKEKHKE